MPSFMLDPRFSSNQDLPSIAFEFLIALSIDVLLCGRSKILGESDKFLVSAKNSFNDILISGF